MMNSIKLLLTTAILAFCSQPTNGQCEPMGLDNPYSNDVYGVLEWDGHYYDAGWFHLRRRPVEGGTWNSFGGGISGGGGYTLADPMIVYGDELIIGGAFFTAGGLSTPNICAWNGTSFRQLGSGLNGEVLALVEWNGRIVAGGDFTFNGSGTRQLHHVAVLDPEMTEWSALGDGLGNFPSGYGSWRIGGLCVHEGELYATGRFQSSGGTTLNGVARFDEPTAQWRPLGSGISGMSNGNVGTAIASHEGELWLSGWFQSIGGVSAPWLAIWNGSSWRGAPAGASRHCLNLDVLQGRLHGSGPFSFTIGGIEHDIARLEDGVWVGLGSADENWPNDIAESADGSALLVGGYFSGFNGEFTGNFLRLQCEGVPTTCPGDIDGNGQVGVDDLLEIIANWGTPHDVDDLLLVISAWGECA